MQTLRIFISSPGDVVEERTIALRVIARLHIEFADRLVLKPVTWEREPLLATAGFQEQLVLPSATDIVIAILWSRLGSPLPASYARADGSRYQSGTEFEFEDAVRAHQASGRPDLLVYRKTAACFVRLDEEEASLERMKEKRALDNFFRKWFYDESQAAYIAAFHDFESPHEFEELLEIHLRKLIDRLAPELRLGEPRPGQFWQSGSPYRGLHTFEFEHAEIFFGRAQAVADILRALRYQGARGRAFVLVLGMSGGGKSSVVRAGVLPTLTEPGVIEGVVAWRRAIYRPSDSPGRLVDGLASALLRADALPALDFDKQAAQTLPEELRASPETAAARIEAVLAQTAREATGPNELGDSRQARLVLVIDQMEEMFTLEAVTASERRDFMRAIDCLARSGVVWVIATLRSDFYPRCAELDELTALKEGTGQYDLRPPSAAEIGQMIRLPAYAAGLRFAKDRTSKERLDEILRDAATDRPAVLPLLEFTLEELYLHRTPDGLLTCEAYRELGGVEGSLGQRAEKIFADLPSNVQAALPRVLNDLISIDEAAETVGCKRFPRAEVASKEANALIEAFLAARLFVTELADDERPVVSFAHEALLEYWPRAKAWISDNTEGLRIRARVAAAAKHWAEAGQSRDLLLPSGLPLGEGKLLLQKEIDLGEQERQYIAASLAKARRVGYLRAGVTASLAVLTLTAVLAAMIANDARDEATHRRGQADDLIGFMLGDLREKLQPIGRLDVLDSVGDKVGAYLDSLREEDITGETLAKRAVAYRQIGEVRMAQGNLEAAMEDFQSSLQDSQRLVRSAPANGDWQFNLAQAHFWIGYVQRERGDLEAATRHLRQYLSTAEQLVAIDPTNDDWQLELAYANSALGTTLYARGSYADALERFRQSDAISRRLTDKDSGNTTFQLSLAESLSWIGSALISLGDLPGALQQFRAEAAIKDSLATKDPGVADWQRVNALAQRRIGELLEATGDLEGAARIYRKALRITEMLVDKDRDNAHWQRDLGVLHGRIGRVALLSGDSRGAIDEFRRYVQVMEMLTARDATRTRWQRDLAEAHSLAGTAWMLSDDPQRARFEITAAVEMLQRLADQPDDLEERRYLSRAYLLQGRLWTLLGNAEAARESWSASLDLIEPLTRESTDFRLLNLQAQALLYLDRLEEARPVVKALQAMGFRDPEFVRLCDSKSLGK